MDGDRLERWLEQLRTTGKAVGEMLYGATVYDWVRELQKERGMVERLFVLAVFGDFLGIPPTGNAVEMTGITIYRFAGGKIVEAWSNADSMGMMQQLGVIPPLG